jgi:predicted O-methyltransferase YrrM
MKLRNTFKVLKGFSPAAFFALFRGGPVAARRVVTATLQGYAQKECFRMDVWDVVRSFSVDEEIKLFGGHWMDGSTAPLERYVMAHLLKYFKPKTIVEIGTFRGTSTRVILDNMEPETAVYTVDLPGDARTVKGESFTDERLIDLEHGEWGSDFADHPLIENVNKVFGDTFDPSTWQKLPDNIEFAFIDASHSYDAVRNDTEKILPKLSKDAVVIWHDYTDENTEERGVGKYIRELMRKQADIFVCKDTSLAIRIPLDRLSSGVKRVEQFFPDGSYYKRYPGGAAPWLDSGA